jgi:cytochrome b561
VILGLRHWARSYTGEGRYTPVGIGFHWTMAALVLFQLGWGWYAGFLPAGGEKLLAYRLHSDVGLLIFLLAFGRFAWRAVIPGPINDADAPGVQGWLAHATHIVFYLCFFGLPLSGWAMWSALGASEPLAVAGILPWPSMPFAELSPALQWWILDVAEDVHHVLVLTLTLLVPLHVAAALKHHFWDRHDVLSAMLPEVPDAETPRAAPTHEPKPT